MKEGRLYINGEEVKREPAGTEAIEDPSGATSRVPLYYETLPGGVQPSRSWRSMATAAISTTPRNMSCRRTIIS